LLNTSAPFLSLNTKALAQGALIIVVAHGAILDKNSYFAIEILYLAIEILYLATEILYLAISRGVSNPREQVLH